MKKLLLSTAAVAVLALAAPAYAAEDGGVELELGGYFKGYLGYLNQDDISNATYDVDGVATDVSEPRDIDWLQDSEIHFGGQTTLDNGLTVGAHFEMEADRSEGDIEESYLYFEGDWGRVNAGAEDGAAFLLQVAAPSADANYDGVRQTISPFNYTNEVIGDTLANAITNANLDYAQDPSGYAEKLTYLSPVFAGFQAGLSYAPDVGSARADSGFGFRTDEDLNEYGSVYEGALRYEGQFQDVGIILGGGYSFVELEDAPTGSNLDDRDVWNLGANFKFMAFSLGGAYLQDDGGLTDGGDSDSWVLGGDYTTGPFKFGLSYLNNDAEIDTATDIETNRYTGGVIYEYGPGMTFRGSVSYVDHETDGTSSEDFSGTTVLLGTQVNF